MTPDAEGGRKAALWSTAAHRALEDCTVALMDTLAARPAPVITEAAVATVLEDAPGLGEDQLAAVRVLAGAGLDARTIARLRIDLTTGPLAAGTVVVLDEISQTPTGEVEAVLAAIDAFPGGSIWVLGDPRQSQPVGAGGAADHIERLAAAGVIPSARLTVNRRQIDAAAWGADPVHRRARMDGNAQSYRTVTIYGNIVSCRRSGEVASCSSPTSATMPHAMSTSIGIPGWP